MSSKPDYSNGASNVIGDEAVGSAIYHRKGPRPTILGKCVNLGGLPSAPAATAGINPAAKKRRQQKHRKEKAVGHFDSSHIKRCSPNR